MHFEILTEDSSGARLLELLVPQFLGQLGTVNTWRIHSYKGVGRIPRGLKSGTDPSKRILLERLPALLRGYGNCPGIDALVVVVDADKRDCVAFLNELKSLHSKIQNAPKTIFRLAIEEVEAWYFGDRPAILKAYPKAKTVVLDGYVQDSQNGTWEILADAIYPGGSSKIKKVGWPLPGQIKHEWAEKIGPLLVPDNNQSTSFKKLRECFETFQTD
jgi:hypothetical protein